MMLVLSREGLLVDEVKIYASQSIPSIGKLTCDLYGEVGTEKDRETRMV